MWEFGFSSRICGVNGLSQLSLQRLKEKEASYTSAQSPIDESVSALLSPGCLRRRMGFCFGT